MLKTEIRYAVWKAYDQRCAYTGHRIDNFDNLQIDHIIPRKSIQAMIDQKIVKYDLDQNFQINSLENLLPTTKRPNQQKGSRPLSANAEFFFIELARKKKFKVLDEIEKFKRLEKNEELNALKKYWQEKWKFDQPVSTEIIRKHDEFEVSRKLTLRNDLYDTHHLWNSQKTLAMNGHLPSKFDEIGNCVIEFKNIETMISLTHYQIMSLIKQKESKGISDIIKYGNSYNDTRIFTVIESNAVHLKLQEFQDLVHVLDDFTTNYKKFYEEFEEFVDVLGLERKEDSDYYKLLTTTRDNWNRLLNYSNRYDLNNGTGNEYSFNYNGSTVICLDKKLNNIKFWLIPDTVENQSFESFKAPDNELNVLWRIPDTQDRIRMKDGDVWTAKQCKDWIYKVCG
ncbi:HNH endonuclease family protein [Reichenbachiella versicolor]|uniref:HNH endonuclease domain-containing protein n=1 Tax=Reichenbachiella versicolor TaxID=1821036 RepID=UPI000D6E27B8|nr:HNH endonuclease domain-containing protein [Reichenbachiella versicolor]